MADQLVPPLVLASQLIVPLPAPDKVMVPLVPLHTEVEVDENAADEGARYTVIFSALLLTGVHTAKASCTTARYHLSPTVFAAVIDVVVTANEDQVVWSELISQSMIFPLNPFKVIDGID
jgi:hypothetical protein